VIPPKTYLSVYKVERIEADRVKVHFDGRECEARASDLVALDEAVAYFTETVAKNPRESFGYLLRASAHAENDRIDAALADCDAATRLEPKNPWCYILRGYVWAKSSRTTRPWLTSTKPCALIRAMR
jgi:hypothetical protein